MAVAQPGGDKWAIAHFILRFAHVMAISHDALSLSPRVLHVSFVCLPLVPGHFFQWGDTWSKEARRKDLFRSRSRRNVLFFSEGSQSGRRTSVCVSFVVVVFWLLRRLVFCFDIHDHTHSPFKFSFFRIIFLIFPCDSKKNYTFFFRRNLACTLLVRRKRQKTHFEINSW